MAETAEPQRFAWLTLLRRIGRSLLGLPFPTAWLLALGWAAFIWFLSGRSFDKLAGDPPAFWRVLANLGHTPLFGVLALFLVAAALGGERSLVDVAGVGRWPRIGWREALLVVGLVVLYGVVDELHQSRTAGRTASVLDVVSDGVGALCVVWIVAYAGSGAASERGVRARLVTGIGLCVATALVVSFAPTPG